MHFSIKGSILYTLSKPTGQFRQMYLNRLSNNSVDENLDLTEWYYVCCICWYQGIFRSQLQVSPESDKKRNSDSPLLSPKNHFNRRFTIRVNFPEKKYNH